MKVGVELLWVLATLELSFVLAASTPIVPPDIWWTLKAGELAVQEGRPLTREVFNFTPAEPNLVNVQWLAQVVLYAVHALGGLNLLILLNALLALGLYGGLLWLCWKASQSVRLACAATFLAYLLGLSNLGARPQLLAYPLFLACYAVLWRFASAPASAAEGSASEPSRPGPQPRVGRLWALPVLVAVWANVHGSFVLGPLLPALFLAGHLLEQVAGRHWRQVADRRARALAAATVGAALATLVNPQGVAAVGYVAQLSANPVIRQFVTEWEPTTVETWYGQLYFASLGLVLLIVYATRSYRRLSPTEALLLLVFAYLGLLSVRGIIWWGLVLAPIVAVQLAAVPGLRALERPDRPVPRASGALAGLAVSIALLGAVGSLPWLKEANPLLPPEKRALVGPDTPVAVASFLRSQPPGGRLFNYQGWGGYFDWALWPQHRVFVDGRIEVHPREVWFDYLYISFGRADWEALLDNYGVSHLALAKLHQPDLIELARQSPRWREVYQDEQAVVFATAG